MLNAGYIMQKVYEALGWLKADRGSFEERLQGARSSLIWIYKKDDRAPESMADDYNMIGQLLSKYGQEGHMAPISDQDRIELCRLLVNLYCDAKYLSIDEVADRSEFQGIDRK